MRLGLMSIATLLLIFFLLIISSGDVPPKEIDRIFENIDVNVMNKLDEDVSYDGNLAKFIKYTGKGIADEFHGTYYLAAWLNTFLPEWVLQNLNTIIILAILAILSPVLFYGTLTIIAVVLIVHEKIKERRERKREKGKE